ncbi:MAG TPA: DUF255 domain-containing protein [Thermoanaerobaculia bacterium]|jgi:hypothetical protein
MVRRLVLALIFAIAARSHAQLANEASRYLQEAANSPVKWMAWGDAAVTRAKAEKKPLFVSIGYAANFETFLMQREAFAEALNTKALNEWYVPVLLDSIEHPEIARAYQRVANVTAAPLNVVLTHDLEPYASIGFADAPTLQRFLVGAVNRWDGEREKAIADARANIARAMPKGEPAATLGVPLIETVVDDIAKTYDAKYGGFGIAPKTLRPMTISFLFRYAQYAKHEAIRNVGVDTIRKIAVSAIHDQLGSGFHRATHDAEWGRPQFEKMLEDQALMAMASLEAWQLTRDPALGDLTRATLDFALRDMRAPHGGFDASMDAHSLVPLKRPEQFNGAFYYWGRTELGHIFGDKALRLYALYGIPEIEKSIPLLANRDVLKEPDVGKMVQKMYEIRQKRPSPARDFNEIAALHGLMISALARGGAAFEEKRYLEAAVDAARVVTTKLWDEKKKKLWRNDAATKPRLDALAQDYALVVQGLLDLFDATRDPKWLELARTIHARQDELFWEKSRYTTGATLPAALRGLHVDRDEGTPAANSVAAMNLLRLAAITGHTAYAERANAIFATYSGGLHARGGELAQLANAYVLSQTPAKQVVLVGDARKKETYDLIKPLYEHYTPLRALIFVPHKGVARERMERLLPFVKAMKNDTAEKPIAWVCVRGECQTTSDPLALLKLVE